MSNRFLPHHPNPMPPPPETDEGMAWMKYAIKLGDEHIKAKRRCSEVILNIRFICYFIFLIALIIYGIFRNYIP